MRGSRLGKRGKIVSLTKKNKKPDGRCCQSGGCDAGSGLWAYDGYYFFIMLI